MGCNYLFVNEKEMKKILRIFGLRVAEVETLTEAEVINHDKPKNPQGAILDVMPEELERQKAKEIIAKYKDL
jgi:hypothetical protein